MEKATISIKIDKSDYEIIKEAAKKEYLSLASYVRKTLLEKAHKDLDK